MATTLPTVTQTIDTAFTQTWQEMKAAATDQILDATVVWALLKSKGVFTTQVGGNLIEETVKYAYNDNARAIVKGDVLEAAEVETHTAAYWTFRNMTNYILRDHFTDIANAGKYKIRDYVKDRTEACLDGLKQKYEDDVMRAEVTDESGKEIQSIRDIVPAYANRATGTYGKLSRANTWWQPKYKQWTSPIEVNMVSDMRNFFNTVTAQQEKPDIILTTQALYENYEDFGLDAIQVMHDEKILNLGFDNLKFKGATLSWADNVPTGDMYYLNSKYIKAVYEPRMWFDMTEWKSPPNQLERTAHVLCRMNLICNSLRRQGKLYA